MYVNILAIATGSRPRKLKEVELIRHLALGRPSKLANSSLAIPMRTVLRRNCRNRKICLGTAATWRIGGYSST